MYGAIDSVKLPKYPIYIILEISAIITMKVFNKQPNMKSKTIFFLLIIISVLNVPYSLKLTGILFDN